MHKLEQRKNLIQKRKVKKVTHVYLNEKYLRTIPKLQNPQHLIALYLHNNEITQIRGLENTENLTHLYLQQNKIGRIENLDKLRKLKKLYLGQNAISVLEDVLNLVSLEELYLEKQTLPEGNSLCFEPRSIQAISHSLQILNISHNKIQTIACLKPLRHLKILNASYNDLNDIDEICEVIKEWFYLENLTFVNNPVNKQRHYQEDLIANAYCLRTLDEKEISDYTRNFLKRLHEERKSYRPSRTKVKYPEVLKKYSSAIQKAVSINVLKQTSWEDQIFDEENAIFIPWKTLPKPQNVSKLQLINQHKIRSSDKTVIKDKFDCLKI